MGNRSFGGSVEDIVGTGIKYYQAKDYNCSNSWLGAHILILRCRVNDAGPTIASRFT